MIGTTDIPFHGDPAEAAISAEETRYLCDAVGSYFSRPVTPPDVVWSFAGVRPLFGDGADDPSAVTRDYELGLDTGNAGNTGGGGGAPLLSVFGGKVTTYRRLAENAMARLRPYFDELGGDWTATSPLPGGDLGGDREQFDAALALEYPEIPEEIRSGLARRHGALARNVLGQAKTLKDLGQHFGAGLTACEIDYLIAEEWAATADDILWRRTKCGLHLDDGQRRSVAAYLAEHTSMAT